jgi:hypothetical protein
LLASYLYGAANRPWGYLTTTTKTGPIDMVTLMNLNPWRVRLSSPIDFEPYATVEVGSTGQIVQADDFGLVIRLDVIVPGLHRFNNEVTLLRDDVSLEINDVYSSPRTAAGGQGEAAGYPACAGPVLEDGSRYAPANDTHDAAGLHQRGAGT